MYLLRPVFPLPLLLLLRFPPLPRHSLKKMYGSTIRFVAWKPEADLMLITIRVAWPSGWERWTCNSEAQSSSPAGPVTRSLVSANRWLRGIKMYRFPWYSMVHGNPEFKSSTTLVNSQLVLVCSWNFPH